LNENSVFSITNSQLSPQEIHPSLTKRRNTYGIKVNDFKFSLLFPNFRKSLKSPFAKGRIKEGLERSWG